MSVLTVPASQPRHKARTLQDLLNALGNIPLNRIRVQPPPGTAVEQDLIDVEARENCLCELIDATLVEKAMGYRESLLAVLFIELLGPFIRSRNLGMLSGSDGTMRLMPGLVRIPDVAFTSWARVPGGKVPQEAIPDLAPDLAIEVLSESNTPGEMNRKCREYFGAGVRLVWIVDPRDRTVAVYTGIDQFSVASESDSLSGGNVLPGWKMAVRDLFAELDRRA